MVSPARRADDAPTPSRPTRRAPAATAGAPAPAPAGAPGPRRWAERGWWLAVEYGVLARDRFLKRLDGLRGLGEFKELLEPGGAIVYRNLFRPDQLAAAWDLFTALRPWQERITCYLKGDVVPAKSVQDVLWCAAFLQKERPCRGTGKGRPAGCEGSRISLAAGGWEDSAPGARHAMTFTSVDAEGWLRFDRDAIAEWVRAHPTPVPCPASPLSDPVAFASAFQDVSVRSLDWPLVAELPPQVEKRLGKALEAEHGFVLRKGEPALDPHAQLELRLVNDEVVVRRPGAPPKETIGTRVRVPIAVRRALEKDVAVLRAVRIHEGFVRLEGGHYEVEQLFVLSARVHLGPADRPQELAGWALRTHPRATPEWEAWADRVAAGLP